MPYLRASKTGVWVAALCLYASGQTPPSKDPPAKDAPAKEAQVNEIKGMPPRPGPTDYQGRAKVGTMTVAAEFQEHAVPTPDGIYSDEDYVTVEVGFFGPPGAHLKLSADDFSLRINGKSKPLPTRPFGMVLSSLKDPNWEPPPVEAKSKTSLGTGGGGGGQGDPPPPPPKMPFPLHRAMELKVQKAALPEGDRALPQAGLIFFSYHGLSKGIRTIELIYNGPAGKAFLALHP